jgi:ferredoxin-type protein NapG
MDRRDFFRKAAGKVAKAAVEHADRKAVTRAEHWVRPPFAIDELEFLIACTRCNACIEVCPKGVVFPLSARLGAQVMNTPALDLLNKGCVCCDGWPCVAACEPGALNIPECDEENVKLWPRMARVELDENLCLPYLGPECGACQGSCPVKGAMTWENERPVIHVEKCTGCACCREACIVEPKAIKLFSLHKKEE